MKTITTKTGKIGILALVIALIALVPCFTKSNYIISVGVTTLAFACFGTAWNIIGGYAGQISWSHATFVAIGAYSSFLLFNNFGITPWIGMLVGVAISMLAAFIIGAISFRLRGPFFSLCTIAFAEIVRVWLLYAKSLTKGAEGIVITFKEESFLNLMFRKDTSFFYIMLAFLVICVFVSWRLKNSKTGYYLRAIRADEDAAESLGITSKRVKLRSFLISAMMTSAVGTVYTFFLTYIDPASVSAMDLSIKIGTMAIVGGAGTLFGPVIGAFVLIPLSEVANILLGQSGSGMLLYGLVMILVTIFRPGGIISFFVKTPAKQSLFQKGSAALKKRRER